MRKDKIIHIISSLGSGGAEKVLTDIVCQLPEFEHVVISLKNDGFYYNKLINKSVETYQIGMNKYNFIVKLILLFKIVVQQQPQVIQGWLYHGNLISIMCRLFVRSKIVWCIHSTKVERLIYSRSIILLNKICAFYSKSPDAILFVSKASLKSHICYGYKNKNMPIINNGYDLSKFYYDSSLKEQARKNNLISSDTFVIGCIGRLHPAKDHENFFSAVAKIKNKFVKFNIVMAGAGIDVSNEKLIQLIAKYDLVDNIILLGVQSDMNQVYNMLDLLVLSSYTEAFPNVLVEAMCCQLPCVTTDAGDARIIVDNDCYVVPVRDATSLANAIFSIASLDVEARKNLGIANRNKVFSRYTIENMLKNYKEFYSQLLSS